MTSVTIQTVWIEGILAWLLFQFNRLLWRHLDDWFDWIFQLFHFIVRCLRKILWKVAFFFLWWKKLFHISMKKDLHNCIWYNWNWHCQLLRKVRKGKKKFGQPLIWFGTRSFWAKECFLEWSNWKVVDRTIY